ncbi:RagB/SusD family nutrient uptake outer membrane protein [Chryseolinea lacunae]|uniref:RagB/SusD family nutrient uptake outer membrane protein n=1 Tax=Chryseolinea lacunae TaxID=2801331 RepID=A0ABS1KRD0_9BACT|nr:RagB/SusD family nutrient uptake outer membrane protein [Chryseolinea lacunae]MBL0741247.1 RagB/SusD family nutrient uptake outer membrane protein [Chryseolinea lacunae]
MKTKISLLVVAFVVCNSCNNLDLVPLDKITADSYYKTAPEFDAAMFAAYSSIQDFWGTSTETLGEMGEYWKITDVVTDDVNAEPNSDNISKDADRLNFRASDKPFAAIYTQIYEGIYRANTVLEHLAMENELSDAEKSLYDGEAKFLRAYFHFEALKLWGTPPLVMETFKDLSKLSVPNATKEQLYTQILADFNDAFTKLPATWAPENTGRATKWAAMAYIGKVNVWKGQPADMLAAITAFEAVIDNGVGAAGKYGLIDTDNPEKDLEDVFAFDNENNKESIFEIQYGGPHSDDNIWVFDDTHSEAFKASQGTGRSWFWDAANNSAAESAPGGKLGYWTPTQNLVDAFEAGDERLNSFIYQAGDTYYIWNSAVESLPYDPEWSSTGYNVKKYSGKRNSVGGDFSGNNQGNFNNERIFRFAELKLLYAEALLASGRAAEATDQINDIRDRAGLDDLPGLATLADLQHEKRVELCFEAHRWFDLVRWGLGPTLFPADWNAKYEVYPFPQSEVDRTKGTAGEIKQNKDY